MEGLRAAGIGLGLDFKQQRVDDMSASCLRQSLLHDHFYRSQLILHPVQNLLNKSALISNWSDQLRSLNGQFKCQATGDNLKNLSSEPKWKEKLVAINENMNRLRMKSLQVQEDYKKQEVIAQREKVQVPTNAYSIKDLEFLPYLTDEGIITNISIPDAKASVYAIFDQNKLLQYIGISRQVYMSMRLHFARVPSKCHFVKIQNINKPNRCLLEYIKEKWIEEIGFLPIGNDNGPQQNIWENPLDCKLLMTEEEKQKLEEAGPGPLQAKVLKNLARRIEHELAIQYKERNCKEPLWFEPKLKEKGLLDLRNKQPDKSVPISTLKHKFAAVKPS